eukprot:438893-Heterocapsa_arctica.AAC.1
MLLFAGDARHQHGGTPRVNVYGSMSGKALTPWRLGADEMGHYHRMYVSLNRGRYSNPCRAAPESVSGRERKRNGYTLVAL